MTPGNNSRNEPDPRIQQDTQWLDQYRATKRILRRTQRQLTPEKNLDLVDKVRQNIQQVKDNLDKISRWIGAVKSARESYFKSILSIKNSLSEAKRELTVIKEILNTYDTAQKEGDIRKIADCVRVLHESSEQYQRCIEQALREFRQ
jgi:hypothetical protein